MAIYNIPSLGATGTYVFAVPYSTLALPDDDYTCKSVRNISDYVGNIEDPYNNIYVLNGLTSVDYQNDLVADMPIVGLQSQIGHWLYVPVRFIESFPQTTGIPYVNKVLAINIGAVDSNQDLTFLKTGILNLVNASFGITAEIQEVITSKTSIIPYLQDTQIQTARKTRVTLSTSDAAYVKILQTNNAQLVTRLTALEQYILSKKAVLGI